MRKNILITGKPKSGKSTLLRSIVESIDPKVGFLTREIREAGERIGFEIETHQQEKTIFCNTRLETPHQVSRYFINLPNLEAMLPNVSLFGKNDLLYLDEIGQMQLLSNGFKKLVLKYLDAPNTCLATISSIFEDDFTRLVKGRDDVILVTISEEDRAEKQSFVTQLIRKIEKARKYVSEPDRFIQNGDDIELHSEHNVRRLRLEKNGWSCNCDFFMKYRICSHTIATEETRRSFQAAYDAEFS